MGGGGSVVTDQTDVLVHQGGPKASSVPTASRSAIHYARARVVDLSCPVPPSRRVEDPGLEKV